VAGELYVSNKKEGIKVCLITNNLNGSPRTRVPREPEYQHSRNGGTYGRTDYSYHTVGSDDL